SAPICCSSPSLDFWRVSNSVWADLNSGISWMISFELIWPIFCCALTSPVDKNSTATTTAPLNKFFMLSILIFTCCFRVICFPFVVIISLLFFNFQKKLRNDTKRFSHPQVKGQVYTLGG